MFDQIPENEQTVGAKVVCFTSGGAGVYPSVRISTISKVNAKTFRVDGESETFPRDSCERRGAGRWPTSRHVTLASSEHGKRHITEMRNRNADAVVKKAYEFWNQAAGAIWDKDSKGDPRELLVELRDKIDKVLATAPKYVVDTEA